MERSKASLMPPPPPMPPPRASAREPSSASDSVNPANSDHRPASSQKASSLMPPPPPMPPPGDSARPESSDPSLGASAPVNPARSDGDSDVPSEKATAQNTQADEVSLLSSEKREGSLQTSEEMEKRNNSVRMQSSSFSSSIYTIPSWSAAPAFPFTLEVIKDGSLIDTLNVSSKGAYMFGRSDQCDFMMEHPSISRFHAVLQFKRNGEVFIYDLGSTHGTIINKRQVAGRTYVPLHVGDVFKMGLSSRLYVFQGPVELMPKEGPTEVERQILRDSQGYFDMADQEASLLRAKREAEGATWGMMEDAVEGDIQEEEEVTWQTYKGELTEKQQKTLEKIQKRNEKVASLKREIDAIQVKEIPQGGLTQGQQTQVARNQQRIEQLMEELDNLEETLNQSIQESIGARARKASSRKGFEDEEDVTSDDDDFYDRTIFTKNHKGGKRSEPAQIVETVDSLLEKQAKVLKELERLNQLLEAEGKKEDEISEVPVSQDPLDAFMTSVSSKLENDRAANLRKEIENQQADLNRILFLLKVADPSGEAQQNWKKLESTNSKADPMKLTSQKSTKKVSDSKGKQVASQETIATENMKNRETSNGLAQVDEQQEKPMVEGVTGPLRLGHARKSVVEKAIAIDSSQEMSTSDQEFIEYKERHKSVLKVQQQDTSSDIPANACGLTLRKPKDAVKVATDDEEDADKKLWEGAALAAADTVALLLRHQRGLGALVDEEIEEESSHNTVEVSSASKKRKLGPERPEFLNREDGKFQAWVPPAGQTGDGRTSLNEKYGY